MTPNKNLRRGFLIGYFPYIAAIVTGATIAISIFPNIHSEKDMSARYMVELEIGEKGDVFARKNSSHVRIDRQPAGLNFYEFGWPMKELGNVVIRHGKLQLPINYVLSATGIEDMDFVAEGISDIKINFALSNSKLISHDEARLKMFSLMQNISKTGWRAVVPRDAARIHGRERNDYLLDSQDYIGFDPNYLPTLNEWMRYESMSEWQFYFDRVFLTVEFNREHTLLDPAKLGAYLISINLESEAQHFRGYVSPSDRPRWKELLPSAVARMAKNRAKIEAALRLKGRSIDESYVDPLLPEELE